MGKSEHKFDVAIVGGGVLGVSLYYWLTSDKSIRVVLIEKENEVARHTSGRNTGVIHRPFYLNPETKRMQAASAGLSYFMWRDLAIKAGIPWNECGTIEVATGQDSLKMLDKYEKWSYMNGLTRDDFQLLSGSEVREIEKEVACEGAILSRTDVSTDFGALTEELLKRSGNDSSIVMKGARLVSVNEDESGCTITVLKGEREFDIDASFLINAAGGSSMALAHSMGYGLNHAVLFFRGEYWKVKDADPPHISHNIYTVPRHTGYPFLDPHFIIKSDGSREIGPNAVLVGGPEVYSGISGKGSSIISSILENPVFPKVRLLFNREFITLVSSEWKSSINKSEMASRIREFIPSLMTASLTGPGISGVRASVINRNGFVAEAFPIAGRSSMHIVNYNSPGATGAPAYSAYVIGSLAGSGMLERWNPERPPVSESWDYGTVISRFST